MVDEEAVLGEIAAGAVVDLGTHQIGQAKLLAGQVRKRQGQPTLPLVGGIIDDDEIATGVLAGPGLSDETVRGPVARPGRQRLDLRPRAVAKGTRL